jgi:hypothetical protein
MNETKEPSHRIVVMSFERPANHKPAVLAREPSVPRT